MSAQLLREATPDGINLILICLKEIATVSIKCFPLYCNTYFTQ